MLQSQLSLPKSWQINKNWSKQVLHLKEKGCSSRHDQLSWVLNGTVACYKISYMIIIYVIVVWKKHVAGFICCHIITQVKLSWLVFTQFHITLYHSQSMNSYEWFNSWLCLFHGVLNIDWLNDFIVLVTNSQYYQ